VQHIQLIRIRQFLQPVLYLLVCPSEDPGRHRAALALEKHSNDIRRQLPIVQVLLGHVRRIPRSCSQVSTLDQAAIPETVCRAPRSGIWQCLVPSLYSMGNAQFAKSVEFIAGTSSDTAISCTASATLGSLNTGTANPHCCVHARACRKDNRPKPNEKAKDNKPAMIE
jgi:hypothetical protein